MKQIFIVCTVTIFTLLPLFSSPADARLNGEVELGYDYYDRSGNDPASKSALSQRYSLVYSGGKNKGSSSYGYLLGYEWLSIDSNTGMRGDASDSNIKTGHLLYAGEYKFEPREMPVKFIAYSRDLNRGRFISSQGSVSGNNDILLPYINDDIQSGLRMESGFSLILGSQFDSFKYSSFNQLPILQFDFKDSYIDNRKSATPEHSRYQTFMISASDRGGGGGIYYTNRKTLNYLATAENSGTSEYQALGVGMANAVGGNRAWKDLTNWIRISADGQFVSSREGEGSDRGKNVEYSVNLFGIVTRPRWEARNFNSFVRRLDNQESKTDTITVPLYIRGDWGVDTQWQSRVVYESTKQTSFTNSSVLSVNPPINKEDMRASLNVEAFKRSPFTLTPSFSIQRSKETTLDSMSAEASADLASTRRFSDIVGIFASYKIIYNADTMNNNLINADPLNNKTNNDSESLKQTFSGRISYKYSDRLVIDASQLLTYSVGSNNGNGQDSSQATSTYAQLFRTQGIVNNNYMNSNTTLKAAWSPAQRLRTSVQASVDVKSQQGAELDSILSLSSSINYALPEMAFNGSVRLAKQYIGGTPANEQRAIEGSALYTPNKNLQAMVRGSYSMSTAGSGEDRTELRQRVMYTFFSPGIGRKKLIDLTEEATLEKGSSSLSNDKYNDIRRFSLLANYYPFRQLFVGATTRYSLLDPGNVSEWMQSISFGANYAKLQASIDAAYGIRSGSDKRTEKRVSANVKKQF